MEKQYVSSSMTINRRAEKSTKFIHSSFACSITRKKKNALIGHFMIYLSVTMLKLKWKKNPTESASNQWDRESASHESSLGGFPFFGRWLDSRIAARVRGRQRQKKKKELNLHTLISNSVNNIMEFVVLLLLRQTNPIQCQRGAFAPTCLPKAKTPRLFNIPFVYWFR